MKPIILILLFFLSSLNPCLWAQEKQVVVPYTLADRDRVILMDAKIGALDAKINSVETSLNARISSLEANMNLKFEGQQRQFDDIKSLFYWGFGILITLFIFMLGYMIWDRRTAMHPILIQASKAEANSSNLILSLKDYSKKHPELAEILKSHGIL